MALPGAAPPSLAGVFWANAAELNAIASHSTRWRTSPGRVRSTIVPTPPPSDSPSAQHCLMPSASSTASTSPAIAAYTSPWRDGGGSEPP